LLTTREAAESLGIRSVNTIKHWVRTGYLHGVQRNERLMIPIEEIERIQHDDQVRSLRAAARVEDEVADLGLDRLLTQEELDALSQTRPGRLPWAKQNTVADAP
jgi:predicted site-specific integrase-resolvase